jgi:hypothetical protein
MNMKQAVFAALAAAVLAVAGPAAAKCTVTLKLTNGESGKITVLGNDSQARVNGGLWSKMGFSNVTIDAGDVRDVAWTTNFSCGGSAKRDLRFKYQKASDNQVLQEMVDNIDISDGGTVRVTLNN